jgi:hypothetical protein
MDAVRVREQDSASDVQVKRIAGIQSLLLFVQGNTHTLHEWVAWSKQRYQSFRFWRFSVHRSDDSMERERQSGWVNNLELDLQRVGRIDSKSLPILQVNPLSLGIFLQLGTSFRRFRGAQGSVGRISGSLSRLGSGFGLKIDSTNAEKSN